MTAIADTQGQFDFTGVHVGQYQVDATAPGSSERLTAPFSVAVAARHRVDVQLQVGKAAETVTVSGAASVTSRDAFFNVNEQRSEFNNFLLDGWRTMSTAPRTRDFPTRTSRPRPTRRFNVTYGQDGYSEAFSQNGGETKDAGASQAAYLADFLVGARNTYQLNNVAIVNYPSA